MLNKYLYINKHSNNVTTNCCDEILNLFIFYLIRYSTTLRCQCYAHIFLTLTTVQSLFLYDRFYAIKLCSLFYLILPHELVNFSFQSGCRGFAGVARRVPLRVDRVQFIRTVIKVDTFAFCGVRNAILTIIDNYTTSVKVNYSGILCKR